jgi:hypothetical protein
MEMIGLPPNALHPEDPSCLSTLTSLPAWTDATFSSWPLALPRPPVSFRAL